MNSVLVLLVKTISLFSLLDIHDLHRPLLSIVINDVITINSRTEQNTAFTLYYRTSRKEERKFLFNYALNTFINGYMASDIS